MRHYHALGLGSWYCARPRSAWHFTPRWCDPPPHAPPLWHFSYPRHRPILQHIARRFLRPTRPLLVLCVLFSFVVPAHPTLPRATFFPETPSSFLEPRKNSFGSGEWFGGCSGGSRCTGKEGISFQNGMSKKSQWLDGLGTVRWKWMEVVPCRASHAPRPYPWLCLPFCV